MFGKEQIRLKKQIVKTLQTYMIFDEIISFMVHQSHKLSLGIVCETIVHFKRLSIRGFQDLSNHYLCFFSKHSQYCKTEA